MNRKKISRKKLIGGCVDPGPGDGHDPRYDARTSGISVGSRKALQLCRQVARTIEGVMLGECDDDILRDLIVESVTPAPHSGRLLVTVSLAPSAKPVSAEVILERLDPVRGLLRSAVAADITRRKAPELIYFVAERHG
jgi:ribosome-binding factor A